MFIQRRLPTCLLLMVFLLTGCTGTKTLNGFGTVTGYGSERVLLMPLDVELMELTAGGVPTPRDEWTDAAIVNIETALDDILLETADATVVDYRPSDAFESATRTQMVKLHEAVGQSILAHLGSPYGAAIELPTKRNNPDWSLGPLVQTLNEGHGADYALFITMRDSYSSGGRVALNVVTAVLFGFASGGIQAGYASLVDLETGDVVWFSRLVSETGDLRTPEPARHAVEALLDDFPL